MSLTPAYDISNHVSLIYAKASEAPTDYARRGLAAAMYWAAYELWNAEYDSWKALVDLFGLDSSAAQCAWRRRTAYSEAVSVLHYPAFYTAA